MNPVQPNTLSSLILAFRSYLATLSLGTVSKKLYLGDIKRFLAWLNTDLSDLTQFTSPKIYLDYLSLPSIATSPTLAKRTLASLRQFGTFIATTYGLPNPITSLSLHNSPQIPSTNDHQLASSKYIKTYTEYLNSLQLSSGTIKSYKSDTSQYLTWLESKESGTQLNYLLIEKNIEKYLNYLSQLNSVSSSTIDRKAKSLLKFALWFKARSPQIVQSDKLETPTLSNYSAIVPLTHHTSSISTFPSPDVSSISVKKFNYRNLRSILPIFILLLLTSTLTIFGYRQFSSDVKLTAAYPSTPVTPNRQLSFQGRLENAGGTPITVATNLTFKLFDASSGGTELYSSGVCSITPDTDGVFNTQIGDTCGSAITSSVFTENQDVWLEVTVAAETLTPRQQIATVAYALNSETLQGFPLSSTVSAIRNTVVPMNQWGEIIVGEQSPRMTGVSGTFQISAPALSFTTTTGSNGNITLAPDGTGQVNLNGNTTTTSFFNVSNAQLTTGSLITGTAATNNTGFNLINLLSGSSPTSKFSVTDTGNTTLAGDLTVTGDDIFLTTNSSGYLLIADGTNFNPTAVSGDITISGSGVTVIGADKITESMLKSVNGPTDELCLSYESSVGDFEWQSCGGSGGSSNWRITNGALSPLNDTLDVLIGSNATDSAKVKFINISNGTPTASISGTTANVATFLTGEGNLATTNMAPLAIGGSTTGPITIGQSGKTVTLPTLTANRLVTTTTGGQLTTSISSANLASSITNETGTGVAVFGTSPTITTRLTISGDASASGSYVFTGSPSSFDVLNGSDLNFATSPGGDVGLTTKMTLLNNGWFGIGDTTPDHTLDVAGNIGLDAGGYINFGDTDGTSGYGFRDNAGTIEFKNSAGVWAGIGSGGGSWTDAGTYLYPTSGEVLGNSSSGGANKLAGIYLADSSPLVFGTDNDFSFSFSGSTLGSTLSAGTLFGINTTTALATLDVRGNLGTVPNASISGNTAMASLVVDQSGIGDLFTASKSGDTKFVITNAGNVGIGVAAPTNKLEIGGSTSTISNASGDITIDSASNNISFAGDSLINILNTYVSGELGLGLADAVAKLDVHGAVVGKALVMFNEIGDQDIFTASASGNTRARLTNSGSLSLDGDYINLGLTDGSSGYGFRDNAGTMEFKNLAGSWSSIGSAGYWARTSGNLYPTTTNDTISATTSASVALTLTQTGAFNALLVEDQASDTTPFVIDQSGNVGIGVSAPTQKLEVNGYIVGQRFVDSSSSSNYLDPADSTTSLAILGDINNTDTTAEFKISSSNNQNIKIDAGSGTVTIGAAGAGKLDAGTIDPPYTINGSKFATYMSSMTGVKEETTGVVRATTYIPGQGYRATLNFAESLTGSDLWLFAKVTDLENNLHNLVVLTSAEGSTDTWYKVEADTGKLHLFASSPTNISYRLTAPRFDASNWANTRDSDSIGFEVNDDNTWNIASEVRDFFSSQTEPASPLSESPVEFTTPVSIKPENDSTPALVVEGEIQADTISAREIQIEQATISGTLYADKIVSPELDEIKSSISNLESSISATITDRIKERLDSLLGNDPSAADLSTPPEATESAPISDTIYYPPSTNDDLISSLTTDLAIINNYLAVIGKATITTLEVTNTLIASNITSATGVINLADNTLIVDSTGQVLVNGDLTVSGKILASKAELDSLTIGSAASESALANLLSVYDESGRSVATIDASGSANLATLTTSMISIASPAQASDSSSLASLIGTAQSNATAGESTLLSPNTEITIESPHITPDTLVYLTPTTNTDNKVLFVKSKTSCPPLDSDISPLTSCTPSFTVAVDAPASADIQFNWWIIKLNKSSAL